MAEKTDSSLTPSLTPPFEPRDIPPQALPLDASHTATFKSNTSSGIQPVLDTATSIPLDALQSLPTIAGRGTKCFLANNEITAFLEEDLNLERLNAIHNHLWMAGRPMRARPLHRYKMMGFDILQTQQMDLHLLKFSNRLLLKPLPEWIFDHKFWVNELCGRRDFHESACGFLLSYVWLLATPLDLKLAHDCTLLPSFITWIWWKEFVHDFYKHVDMNALDQVNKRYHFGELRLGRINSIYRTRFAHTHFVRGYLYGYNRYAVFFQRNFSWILVVFIFFSLVLSAMQVGAGVPPLDSNHAFLKSCYIFVVFSIVIAPVILVPVGVMFLFIYFFNMAKAISHDKQTRKERKKLAQDRETKKDA